MVWLMYFPSCLSTSKLMSPINSDCLAEFHLPRSGIEVLIDRMPFPHFKDAADRDGLMFLAVCSVRRLLNRIHNTIYAAGPGAMYNGSSPNSEGNTHTTPQSVTNSGLSFSSLESVCNELLHQLETWYQSLPETIKPDLWTSDSEDRHHCWLRLRYWSAKHIICRPCLLIAVSSSPSDQLPLYVLETAKMCIESCRNYVKTAPCLLVQCTQYTWATTQAYATPPTHSEMIFT